MKRVSSLLCLLLVLAACASAHGEGRKDSGDLELFERLQRRIVTVSRDIQPTVVHIEAILKFGNLKKQVSGSGTVIDKEGHIFTNHHVVENAVKVSVLVPGDRERRPAKILGVDVQTDLAVLKIDPPPSLKVPTFGDSDKLLVGQWVLAVGNPYGFDGSVSFGIVQAKGRNLVYRGLLNEFIQTDALIDMGSSGGPLVNLKGQVVGINSIAAGRGMGFTIPINTALAVKNKLLKTGFIERGWLGVVFQPLDRSLARALGRPELTGVVVNRVLEGSPAAQSDIRPGDVVTRFDGQPVDVEQEPDATAFARLVASEPAGKKVSVELVRDGKPLTVETVVGVQPKVDAEEEDSPYGYTVKEITNTIFLDEKLETREGVFVSFVESGGPAAEAGLQPGDVIVEMGGQPVKNLADHGRAVESLKGKKLILVKVLRGRDLVYLAFETEEKTEGEGP